MKKTVYIALIGACFSYILFFPEYSFKSASFGLIVWFESLVPALLPVMILSNLLVATNLNAVLIKPVYPLFYRTCRLSPGGVYALFSGFLCGFPMGLKILSDLRRQDQISLEEASYLACICGNVSPGFVINYLVFGQLKKPELLYPTLVIVYGAPLLYGLFSNHRYRMTIKDCRRAEKKASFMTPDPAMMDACILNAIQNMTKLGGYLILFSVLGSMTELLPFSQTLSGVVHGILEITAGSAKIANLSLPYHHTYLLLCMVTVFGGLCCAAQSQSMLKTIGVSLFDYIREKLCITAIAFLMAVICIC